MRKLLLLCLLAYGAAAIAQTASVGVTAFPSAVWAPSFDGGVVSAATSINIGDAGAIPTMLPPVPCNIAASTTATATISGQATKCICGSNGGGDAGCNTAAIEATISGNTLT